MLRCPVRQRELAADKQRARTGYAVDMGHSHVVYTDSPQRAAILSALTSPEGRAAILAVLETKEAQEKIVEAVKRHEGRGKR
jgi:hypothetical protein